MSLPISSEKLPMSATSWFTLSSTGMVINRPPTIEEYLEVGITLNGITFSIQYWWGDYIIYGESRADWGEMYSQALDESGRAYHTLTKAVSVCRKIPQEIRNKDVPFSTHAVIAKMSTGEDDKIGHERVKRWLDFIADYQIAGRDVKVLTDVYRHPPVDLRATNHDQERALITAGLISGEIEITPPVDEDDNLLSEIEVLTDKLDRSIELLAEVWDRWPNPVSDITLRRIENVIQEVRPHRSGNGVDSQGSSREDRLLDQPHPQLDEGWSDRVLGEPI